MTLTEGLFDAFHREKKLHRKGVAGATLACKASLLVIRPHPGPTMVEARPIAFNRADQLLKYVMDGSPHVPVDGEICLPHDVVDRLVDRPPRSPPEC